MTVLENMRQGIRLESARWAPSTTPKQRWVVSAVEFVLMGVPLSILVVLAGFMLSTFLSAAHLKEQAVAIVGAEAPASERPIVMLDVNGRVVFANRAATALYGHRDAKKLIGTDIRKLLPIAELLENTPAAISDWAVSVEIPGSGLVPLDVRMYPVRLPQDAAFLLELEVPPLPASIAPDPIAGKP